MNRARIVYGSGDTKRFYIDGVEVTEDEFHEQFPTRIKDLLESGFTLPGHTSSCWPMKSLALGVHPSQIEKATERNRRHGIRVTYDRSGRAILPDRAERKKLIRLEGFRDNNGGYGD